MMKAVLCFGLLAILIGCVRGWGRILSGENSIGYNSWIPARRSWRCGGNRDLCWQNSQCCKGYYCATVDDGKSGFCRAEDQEQIPVCETDSDCPGWTKCSTVAQVGAVKLRMCKEPTDTAADTGTGKKAESGQPGDVCEDNSDCSIADGLCCQYVQVFRRKPKKMCHQISGLNKCIKSTSFGNNIIKK
ncbi:prohormone-3-like isoform X2 [Lineus longissimus]|uniref:prohormone-3-like isoform X2 n=1 Tax=Lineus longissimus TaxID=88925 RepID=UPI002B4F48D4